MKNKILISVAFLFLSNAVLGQFTFGVSPGLSFNGAYFGYKVSKNVIPYIGIQYASISVKYDEKGKRVDDFGNISPYHDKYEFKGGIYVINIGVKHYFKPKNKIRPYTCVNLAKPILRAKLDSGDGELDNEVSDAVKKIKMWGGEWGFGTEYFFDDNFSIGGEFGIRLLRVKIKDDRTEQVFNPNTGDPEDVEITTEAKTGINPTYTRFSLNFYF